MSATNNSHLDEGSASEPAGANVAPTPTWEPSITTVRIQELNRTLLIRNAGLGHCLLLSLLNGAGIIFTFGGTFSMEVLTSTFRQELAALSNNSNTREALVGGSGDAYLDRDAIDLFCTHVDCAVKVWSENVSRQTKEWLFVETFHQAGKPIINVHYDCGAHHYQGIFDEEHFPRLQLSADNWSNLSCDGILPLFKKWFQFLRFLEENRVPKCTWTTIPPFMFGNSTPGATHPNLIVGGPHPPPPPPYVAPIGGASAPTSYDSRLLGNQQSSLGNPLSVLGRDPNLGTPTSLGNGLKPLVEKNISKKRPLSDDVDSGNDSGSSDNAFFHPTRSHLTITNTNESPILRVFKPDEVKAWVDKWETLVKHGNVLHPKDCVDRHIRQQLEAIWDSNCFRHGISIYKVAKKSSPKAWLGMIRQIARLHFPTHNFFPTTSSDDLSCDKITLGKDRLDVLGDFIRKCSEHFELYETSEFNKIRKFLKGFKKNWPSFYADFNGMVENRRENGLPTNYSWILSEVTREFGIRDQYEKLASEENNYKFSSNAKTNGDQLNYRGSDSNKWRNNKSTYNSKKKKYNNKSYVRPNQGNAANNQDPVVNNPSNNGEPPKKYHHPINKPTNYSTVAAPTNKPYVKNDNNVNPPQNNNSNNRNRNTSNYRQPYHNNGSNRNTFSNITSQEEEAEFDDDYVAEN